MNAELCITSSLVRMLLTSLVAGVASICLWLELKQEEQRAQRVLLTLPKGSSYVSLYAGENNPGCFGSITYTTSEENDQVHISARAWIALSLDNREILQEFDCNLVFNALGQLGGSFCETKVADTEIRVGTTAIDPITLSIYVGQDAPAPLLQQNIPGPILVSSLHNAYSITTPFGSNQAIPSLKDLAMLTQATSLITRTDRCNASERAALPLSPTILRTFNQSILPLLTERHT
jgi:hypothetical protein